MCVFLGRFSQTLFFKEDFLFNKIRLTFSKVRKSLILSKKNVGKINLVKKIQLEECVKKDFGSKIISTKKL